jgi:hypothetical protein
LAVLARHRSCRVSLVQHDREQHSSYLNMPNPTAKSKEIMVVPSLSPAFH